MMALFLAILSSWEEVSAVANKSRVLYLLQFLQNNSDENRPVSTAEIREELARHGCPATVETIRDDIHTLQETGYDISVNETNGLSTTYNYVDRPFDVSELQILIDAVASSRFIPLSKSKQLIQKLSEMAGPSCKEEIRPGVLSAEFIKAQDPQFLYIIELIREGIQKKKKIAFQYFQYDLNKNRIPRRDGEEYLVSPYATLWRYDRYFLIGYSEHLEKVAVYRVDRMGLPHILDDDIVPQPEEFNIRDYSEKIFWMYDGPEEQVTLRCKHHMMQNIIDYFGQDVVPRNVTEDMFDVTVSVSVSNTFFSWILGFTGDMTIISPSYVVDDFIRILQQEISDTHTNNPTK